MGQLGFACDASRCLFVFSLVHMTFDKKSFLVSLYEGKKRRVRWRKWFLVSYPIEFDELLIYSKICLGKFLVKREDRKMFRLQRGICQRWDCLGFWSIILLFTYKRIS